jgi:PTH1 family peptidyl-tRNA hydrolase
MWIVAGLGNPGKQYLYTWHNMGYLAVDMLADKHGIFLGKEKYKGLWGKGKINGQDVIIIKPTTYMNNSGECLVEISKFYKVEPKNIITVYDDIDIAKGTIRVRPKGSAGTHNGMRSVIQLLGTQEFPRVRIGTGPVPEHWDLVNYVLSEVPQDERKLLNDAFVKACEAVEEIISNG